MLGLIPPFHNEKIYSKFFLLNNLPPYFKLGPMTSSSKVKNKSLSISWPLSSGNIFMYFKNYFGPSSILIQPIELPVNRKTDSTKSSLYGDLLLESLFFGTVSRCAVENSTSDPFTGLSLDPSKLLLDGILPNLPSEIPNNRAIAQSSMEFKESFDLLMDSSLKDLNIYLDNSIKDEPDLYHSSISYWSKLHELAFGENSRDKSSFLDGSYRSTFESEVYHYPELEKLVSTYFDHLNNEDSEGILDSLDKLNVSLHKSNI